MNDLAQLYLSLAIVATLATFILAVCLIRLKAQCIQMRDALREQERTGLNFSQFMGVDDLNKLLHDEKPRDFSHVAEHPAHNAALFDVYRKPPDAWELHPDARDDIHAPAPPRPSAAVEPGDI